MKFSALVLATLMAGAAHAVTSGVRMDWKYTDAATEQLVRGSQSIELIDAGDKMHKSVMIVKASDQLTQVLSAYSKTCNDVKNEPPADQAVRGRPSPGPIVPRPPDQEREFTDKCKAEKVKVADTLAGATSQYERSVARLRNQAPAELAKIQRLAKNMRDLTKLIREAKPQRMFDGRRALEMAAGARVTTGGAQDAEKFRREVEAGRIPKIEDYQAYGLINEFDLYVAGEQCRSLLCMAPVVSVDEAAKKMYIQVNLGTNVDLNTFKRRPINLAVVLDESGSMSATDDTAKTRLEWGMDAIEVTLDNLVEGEDYFSLVWFSGGSGGPAQDQAGVLWSPKGADGKIRPISAEDKAKIREIVKAQKTRSATNLQAGLDLGYKEINSVKTLLQAEGKATGFEHRLIMISDANFNVDTDDGTAILEVQKQAELNQINLTTIGIGANFFIDFVNKLSVVQGGNFIFAQDGKRMLEYFAQFNLLVTPIAYKFQANVTYDQAKAKLVRMHGVPEVRAIADTTSVLGINTLFLASPKDKGGGAQVLEFDLL